MTKRADVRNGLTSLYNRITKMRALRLMIILSTLIVLVLANRMTVINAAPLNGQNNELTEHAAEDLANTPINQIEQKTADNKAKIISQTKVEPGAARSAKMGISAPTFSTTSVSTDPGVFGSWSSVIDTQVVPIFQTLLPDGKILIWDSVGDNATESYNDQSFTRAMVWDPTNNTFKRVDVQGQNIFCGGFAHLSNGNILVAGGTGNASLQGIIQTHIFDWKTETWSLGPNMAVGRWYPSVAPMANGEETIVGGGPSTAEVYQTNGTIRPLPGFTNSIYGERLFPFMISRPDTQLSLFGPYDTTYTVDTPGNGVITETGTRDGIKREYGSYATYDIGKTLVVGGGDITENGVANVPTKTAVIVNNNGNTPTVTPTGSMSTGRRQFNATVLADGSVLATGGETSAANSPLVDLNNAITAAERWDPATGTWTLLSSASRIRQYHSTAILLPDGRVMTGGGGVCSTCVTVGYLEKNVEYFTPPYLYKHDGSGQLAIQPVISTAPATVPINTNFSVTSNQAASISKVALVGLSSVTHDVDTGQRYVPLKFTVSGSTLNVAGPPNNGVTPPGYYMLFIVDSNGVPSVAKIVQVASGSNPIMSPVENFGAAKCIDIPRASIAIKTYLQGYSCNGTKAQALTRLPNDNSLRVLGNCIDVPYAKFTSGSKIWTYTCNGTVAQKWQFRTDSTIRPLGNTTLCLETQSVSNYAAVLISACNGNSLQKWSW